MSIFIKIRPVCLEFLYAVIWAERDTERNDTSHGCMFEILCMNSRSNEDQPRHTKIRFKVVKTLSEDTCNFHSTLY